VEFRRRGAFDIIFIYLKVVEHGREPAKWWVISGAACDEDEEDKTLLVSLKEALLSQMGHISRWQSEVDDWDFTSFVFFKSLLPLPISHKACGAMVS
jgi:hypothetical protein